MTRTNRKIEEMPHNAWIALNNAERVEEIKLAMDEAKFDQTRRDELRQLMEQVKKRVKTNNTAYTQKTDLTAQRDDQHDALDQLFVMHRRQSRRILAKDSSPYRKLGLAKERSKRLLTWFQQIRSFYSLLLEDDDFKPVVTQYRLTPEFLAQTLSQISTLEKLAEGQKAATSKARQSTKDRDATVEELELTYLEMKDIALRVLKDQPHYLAAMGFVSTEPAPVSS